MNCFNIDTFYSKIETKLIKFLFMIRLSNRKEWDMNEYFKHKQSDEILWYKTIIGKNN